MARRAFQQFEIPGEIPTNPGPAVPESGPPRPSAEAVIARYPGANIRIVATTSPIS